MNINIKQNKKPKLCMPSFNVDNELSSKLNKYEITKLIINIILHYFYEEQVLVKQV